MSPFTRLFRLIQGLVDPRSWMGLLRFVNHYNYDHVAPRRVLHRAEEARSLGAGAISPALEAEDHECQGRQQEQTEDGPRPSVVPHGGPFSLVLARPTASGPAGSSGQFWVASP